MTVQHPITDVSFTLTGLCLLLCGSAYLMFGLWSVKNLVLTSEGVEPRWLLLPLVLTIIGCIWTAVAMFPTALAIGLVYSSSDTIVAREDLWSFVLPMSFLALFFGVGTVKLQYSM
eukprot:TRINITY_DN26999_c0_g1_i1.p1 TRINITY_DN26999_c0_g1~~TRINITY_DN26999_c0_g1_i1.p1  ORF type:complete len:128 (+),score=5.96 TRINITY_DN26999_c0_g1_i1:38-385(+)